MKARRSFRALLLLLLVGVVVLATASEPPPPLPPPREPETTDDIDGLNPLWRRLASCERDLSLKCLKTQFGGYLRQVFAEPDIQVGEFLHFRKNHVDYNTISDEVDDDADVPKRSSNRSGEEVDSNEMHDKEEEEEAAFARGLPSARDPLEDVTRDMRGKAKEFFFTHDIELALPDFIFEGAVVKISPRALHEDGGALVHVDLGPAPVAVQRRSGGAASVGTPRIFFKKIISLIGKFIGERLMWALAAIIIVVKLLSLKFMFFLPMIMGIAAAKKLLLKVILFLFPFLNHLFKLCPYYAPTKFHHHHHQISHVHQIPHLYDLHGIELDHPPPGWHDHHDHHEHHDHYDQGIEPTEDIGYYADGPGLSQEQIGLRRKHQPPYYDEDGEPYPGPPGGGGGPSQYPPSPYAPPHAAGIIPKPPSAPQPQRPGVSIPKIKAGPLSAAEIENMVLKAEKEAMLKARLQEEQKRVELENKRLQDKIKTSMKLQEKLKIQQMVAKQTSKLAAAIQPPPPPATSFIHPSYMPQFVSELSPHSPTIYAPHHQTASMYPTTVLTALQSQLNNIASQPTASSTSGSGVKATLPSAAASTSNNYDAFYSPILLKIDKIFNELALLDEGCRERLVCNMYNDPEKYSPHSNLMSAELSRDASELQKPTTSNSAVIRFYKYVQAARDGQDKRDCAILYPACSIGL